MPYPLAFHLQVSPEEFDDVAGDCQTESQSTVRVGSLGALAKWFKDMGKLTRLYALSPVADLDV